MEKKEQPRDWPAEKIRKAITAKGLSIEELAKLWGLPRSSIYRAMSHPGYQKCEPFIAEYIGFSVEEVFAGRVAERQERAARRAQAVLDAQALVDLRVA